MAGLTVRDVKRRCAVASVTRPDHVQFLVVQIVYAILTGVGRRRAGHGHGATDAADTADASGVVVVMVVMVMVQSAGQTTGSG